MAIITNFDDGQTRDAQIITESSNELNWCIAVWPAPKSGRTKVDGNGHGWQIVREQEDGTYTYNDTMLYGFEDSLDDVKAKFAAAGYTIL